MSTQHYRFSIGPIGWANDDLRGWGPAYSGEQIMREMAEAGYVGSEMSYLYPQDPLALRDALASHGLVLSAAYHWTNLSNAARFDEEMATARRHVDFCARAGAQHALVAEGGGSLHWDAGGPREAIRPLDDASWDRLLRGLNELGIYARSRLLQLCVHPHVGTAIERHSEVERLLEGTDPEVVHWCLDTGHAALAGHEPVDQIRRWGHRLRYVHLKDVRADVVDRFHRERAPFAEAIRWNVFGTPGSGCLDFPAIVAALREVGYTEGWLVVEADQDPSTHPPLTVAREARQFLREITGA